MEWACCETCLDRAHGSTTRISSPQRAGGSGIFGGEGSSPHGCATQESKRITVRATDAVLIASNASMIFSRGSVAETISSNMRVPFK